MTTDHRALRPLLGVVITAFCTGGCSLMADFDGLGGEVPTTSSSTVAASSGAGGAGGGVGGAADEGGAGGGEGGVGAVPNCTPPPNQVYKGLVLNEIDPYGTPSDWIELKNTATAPLDLCGLVIAENYMGGDPFITSQAIWMFDTTLEMAPDGYFPLFGAFAISPDSAERFTLFTPSPSLGIIDDTQYSVDGATKFELNDTWGRIPDGCGEFARIVGNPTLNDENYDPNGEGGAPQCTGSTGAR